MSIEEENVKKRVNQLAHDLGDLVDDMTDRGQELIGLGVGYGDMFQMVRANISEKNKGPFDELMAKIGQGMINGAAQSKLRTVIARLFAEAPKLTDHAGNPDPTQAPALECHVMLRHSTSPLFGVLSETPEGTLRMMTPSMFQKDASSKPEPIMCEQFFEYEDVVSVMVQRAMTVSSGSRIITS